MPEVAEAVVDQAPAARPATRRPATATIKKRWRAWLRAIHRDIGYLAVGFTVIYALSGIAMNHIDDWDPNFHASEATLKITPIPDELSDAEATRRIAVATGLTGKIDDTFRAGDEVRLTYASGSKVTAIGDTVTVQARRDRVFFRVADWLHATRGKQAWKFIADIYAALLLYLAISGIFMIKGRLGLRWRGAALIAAGLAAPIGYIVGSGGPGAQKTEKLAARPGEVDPPKSPRPSEPGITPLPPDDDKPAKPAEPGITPLPPDDDKPAK
jgi:hypothetical protein